MEDNKRYITGVDFGSSDEPTCIAIVDADESVVVALHRNYDVRWKERREHLQMLYERWQPAVIWAEARSTGSILIEILQSEGLPVCPFMTTTRSKTPLIENLNRAIERGELSFDVGAGVVVDQLSSYEIKRTPTGQYKYVMAAGRRESAVMAVALAWYGVKHSGFRVDFA